VELDHAFAIVQWIVREADGPVSVFVADGHGELVAAATMDDAAPDTRLNAQRKAYTAARSDATSTKALAAKVADDPVERASFDPAFTFFNGGVAAFRDGRRVGAVGVSGLAGDDDDRLARAAIEAAGLQTPPTTTL
jgi:glc operon protein GlcG